LHIEHIRFTSVIDGDAFVNTHSFLGPSTYIGIGYLTLQRCGDLISAWFTKGLQMEIKASEVPFWLSELRKQSFAAAYCLDEELLQIVLQECQEVLLHATSIWNRRTISATARLQPEEAVNNLDSASWNVSRYINAFLRHTQQQTLSLL